MSLTPLFGDDQSALTPPNRQDRAVLPDQLTPLIGREQEVASTMQLLRQAQVRLLTITGTGGIGKTRLALQVAHELQNDFADGVRFVSLVSLTDANLVISTIARTFDIRENGDWPLLERLQRFLHEKQLLLLIDNFEQVAPAAPQLAALIAACPRLTILVTSRAVLHLRAEHEFPLAPLALPRLKDTGDLALAASSPSIALFLQRARAIKPDFTLTPANTRTIAEICIRLDGLPLAIELAAARVKLLPPHALLARLDARLSVLTSTARDIPERQRTLRNTLAWSYDLLNEQEQQLFRRLSIFTGGFTLEAAEQLCYDLTLPLLDGIASLLDNSLLNQTEQGEEEPRLLMLETIRSYGLMCLLEQQESIATHQAHAACYLALAEAAEPHLNGKGQSVWLLRLEQEYGNLRAALLWLIEQDEVVMALRLSGALWRFWWMRGQVVEGRTLLEQALARANTQDIANEIYAKALNAAGTLIGLQGDFERATTLCRQSLTLSQAAGYQEGIIASHWMLGYIARETGRYDEAVTLLEQALARSRQENYATGIAYTLEILAAMSFDQGDYARADVLAAESLATARRAGDTWGNARMLWLSALITLFQANPTSAYTMLEESLTLFQAVHDTRGIAYALVMLGYVTFILNQRERTRPLLEKSLALHQEIGDRRGIAWTRFGLGWVDLFEHNLPASHEHFAVSLSLLRELDHHWFIALALEGLAACSSLEGYSVWAAQLWGAAEALRETIGGALSPMIKTLYEPFIVSTRSALGDKNFQTAWHAGRAQLHHTTLNETLLSPPSAIPHAPAVPTMPKYPAGLTAREVDVLRWVARGLTDSQVAEKLVISTRTVSTHLTSIYSKIGVTSRSSATRFALEHHLV